MAPRSQLGMQTDAAAQTDVASHLRETLRSRAVGPIRACIRTQSDALDVAGSQAFAGVVAKLRGSDAGADGDLLFVD